MAVSSRDASSMAQLINRLIADQLNPCRTASSSSSSNPPLPLPLGSDFVMNDIPATFKLITSTASVSLLELIPDSTSSSHPSSAGNISNNTNFTSYTSSNTFIAFFPPQLLQQGQQLDNWLQSILAQAHSHLRTLVHRPHPVIAPSSSNSSAAAESSTNIISQRFLCKELGQQVTPARGHYRIYVAIQVNQNAHLIMVSNVITVEEESICIPA